jgi:hypothetical protein
VLASEIEISFRAEEIIAANGFQVFKL